MASIVENNISNIDIIPGDIYTKGNEYCVISMVQTYGAVRTVRFRQIVNLETLKFNKDNLYEVRLDEFKESWTFYKRGIHVGDLVTNDPFRKKNTGIDLVRGKVQQLNFFKDKMHLKVNDRTMEAYIFQLKRTFVKYQGTDQEILIGDKVKTTEGEYQYYIGTVIEVMRVDSIRVEINNKQRTYTNDSLRLVQRPYPTYTKNNKVTDTKVKIGDIVRYKKTPSIIGIVKSINEYHVDALTNRGLKKKISVGQQLDFLGPEIIEGDIWMNQETNEQVVITKTPESMGTFSIDIDEKVFYQRAFMGLDDLQLGSRASIKIDKFLETFTFKRRTVRVGDTIGKNKITKFIYGRGYRGRLQVEFEDQNSREKMIIDAYLLRYNLYQGDYWMDDDDNTVMIYKIDNNVTVWNKDENKLEDISLQDFYYKYTHHRYGIYTNQVFRRNNPLSPILRVTGYEYDFEDSKMRYSVRSKDVRWCINVDGEGSIDDYEEIVYRYKTREPIRMGDQVKSPYGNGYVAELAPLCICVKDIRYVIKDLNDIWSSDGNYIMYTEVTNLTFLNRAQAVIGDIWLDENKMKTVVYKKNTDSDIWKVLPLQGNFLPTTAKPKIKNENYTYFRRVRDKWTVGGPYDSKKIKITSHRITFNDINDNYKWEIMYSERTGRNRIRMDTYGPKKVLDGEQEFENEIITQNEEVRRTNEVPRPKEIFPGSVWWEPTPEWFYIVITTNPLRYRKYIAGQFRETYKVEEGDEKFKTFTFKKRGPRPGELWQTNDLENHRIMKVYPLDDNNDNLLIEYQTIDDYSTWNKRMTIDQWLESAVPRGPMLHDIYEKDNQLYYVSMVNTLQDYRADKVFTIRNINGTNPIQIKDEDHLSPMLDNGYVFKQNAYKTYHYCTIMRTGENIILTQIWDNGKQELHKGIKSKQQKYTMEEFLNTFVQPKSYEMEGIEYIKIRSGEEDDLVYSFRNATRIERRKGNWNVTEYDWGTYFTFSPNGKYLMIENDYASTYRVFDKANWNETNTPCKELVLSYNKFLAITNDAVFYSIGIGDIDDVRIIIRNLLTLDGNGQSLRDTEGLLLKPKDLKALAACSHYVACLTPGKLLIYDVDTKKKQTFELQYNRLLVFQIEEFNNRLYVMIAEGEVDGGGSAVTVYKISKPFTDKAKLILRLRELSSFSTNGYVMKDNYVAFYETDDKFDNCFRVINYIMKSSYKINIKDEIRSLDFDGKKIALATEIGIQIWTLPAIDPIKKAFVKATFKKETSKVEELLKQVDLNDYYETIPLWTFLIDSYSQLIPDDTEFGNILESGKDYGDEAFEFLLPKVKITEEVIERAVQYKRAKLLFKYKKDKRTQLLAMQFAIDDEEWEVFEHITIGPERETIAQIFIKFELVGDAFTFQKLLTKFNSMNLEDDSRKTIIQYYIEYFDKIKYTKEAERIILLQYTEGIYLQEDDVKWFLKLFPDLNEEARERFERLFNIINFDMVKYEVKYSKYHLILYVLDEFVTSDTPAIKDVQIAAARYIARRLLDKMDINNYYPSPSAQLLVRYVRTETLKNTFGRHKDTVLRIVKWFEEKKYKHFNQLYIGENGRYADTLFIYALGTNDKDFVKALLKITAIDPNIGSPLFKTDNDAMFDLLVQDERIDLNQKNGMGMTPIEFQTNNNGLKKVKVLMQHRDRIEDKYITKAIESAEEDENMPILFLLNTEYREKQFKQVQKWSNERTNDQIKNLNKCKGYTNKLKARKRLLDSKRNKQYEKLEKEIETLKNELRRLQARRKEIEDEFDAATNEERSKLEQEYNDLILIIIKNSEDLERKTGAQNYFDKQFNIKQLRKEIKEFERKCKNYRKKIEALREQKKETDAIMKNCVNDLDSLLSRPWKAEDYQNTIFLDAFMKDGKRRVYCLVEKTFEAEMEEMSIECNTLKNKIFTYKLRARAKGNALKLPDLSPELREKFRKEQKEFEELQKKTQEAYEKCIKEQELKSDGVELKLKLNEYFFPGIYTNWVKTDQNTGDMTDEPMPVTTSGLGGQKGRERYVLIDTRSGVKFYVPRQSMESVVDIDTVNNISSIQRRVLPIVIKLNYWKSVALGKIGTSSGTVSGTHGNTGGDVYQVEEIRDFTTKGSSVQKNNNYVNLKF